MIDELRKNIALDIIASFFSNMNSLGYTDKEAFSLIEKAYGGTKNE